MKRIMMRAFWGINDLSNNIVKRKFRVDQYITKIKENPYCKNFITYVWGKENFEGLKELGFNCELVWDEPFQWDLVECQYRHKLEALKIAMRNYDEILHVDWDCIPLKEEDDNMWELMENKSSFQANLIRYKKHKLFWRDCDRNIVPNGGCVFISDKTIPDKLINYWEELQGPSAEPPMAKYIDEQMGGWKGAEAYWDLFEIPIAMTHRMRVFPKDKLPLKLDNLYFMHYQGGKTKVPDSDLQK